MSIHFGAIIHPVFRSPLKEDKRRLEIERPQTQGWVAYGLAQKAWSEGDDTARVQIFWNSEGVLFPQPGWKDFAYLINQEDGVELQRRFEADDQWQKLKADVDAGLPALLEELNQEPPYGANRGFINSKITRLKRTQGAREEEIARLYLLENRDKVQLYEHEANKLHSKGSPGYQGFLDGIADAIKEKERIANRGWMEKLWDGFKDWF